MRTVVVGAGRMGHGIALSYAMGGHDVSLVDIDDDALARARAAIREAASLLVDTGLEASVLDGAVGRIDCTTRLSDPLPVADLVQEAIHEDLPAKQRLFAELEPLAAPNAILATNTSSLRLDAIGARMARPERLVGIHWVAPPYLVPIVEVVRTAKVSDDLVGGVTALLEALGKVPVVVPDVPGFALNRLQYALFAAAVDLVEQGILDPRDVDLVIRSAMAPRLLAFGILEQFDLVVSGRTVETVADYLYTETGDARYRVGPTVRQMVGRGRLGLISGAGWFEYPGDRATIERRRDEAFARAYGALVELDRRKQ